MKYLLIAALLISINVEGQKVIETKVDKFNGAKTVWLSSEALARTLGVKNLEVTGYAMTEKDSIKSYSMRFLFYAATTLSVDKKHNAIFMFKSGERMSLPYDYKYSIVSRNDAVSFWLLMDREQLEILANNVITDIRFETSAFNHDFEIKEKYQSIVGGMARLLLEN